METLSRTQIEKGLRRLAVQPGSILLVHSSLSSLGHVEGGSDAVIDALLDVLGPGGTLLMPTHPFRDGQVFDPETIPSYMGIISETFRLRPGVLRSRHPYHPVAAWGAQAEEMLRDHEKSSSPNGPDTPYGRLISRAGWVLHIGCDLDTHTLLHAVEAELDLPFLRELTMQYVDAEGEIQTLEIDRCPGGHRGGVLKFDRLFRQDGDMQVGRIGNAVCRLISAQAAAEIMRRELRRDPAFVLDDNPNCIECSRSHGKVRAARLAEEDFQLTALLRPGSADWERTLQAIERAGIRSLEVETHFLGATATEQQRFGERLMEHGMYIAVLRSPFTGSAALRELCALADNLDVARVLVDLPPRQTCARSELVGALAEVADADAGERRTVLVGNKMGSHAETPEELRTIVEAVDSPYLRASLDPAEFARIGMRPFTEGLYWGGLRRWVQHVELRDAVAAAHRAVPIDQGNGQVVKIVSNLRCRSYQGILCLWPLDGEGPAAYQLAAEAFWAMIDAI